MKVYNKDKTQIPTEYDLDKGHLENDIIVKEILPAQDYIEEQGHYETIREYPNGGKDVKWVVDIQGQKAREETPVYEDIQVYIPYTEEEMLDQLREKREDECFSIINRGQLWYDTLSDAQKKELKAWYKAWLDVTETLAEPVKPEWLN